MGESFALRLLADSQYFQLLRKVKAPFTSCCNRNLRAASRSVVSASTFFCFWRSFSQRINRSDVFEWNSIEMAHRSTRGKRGGGWSYIRRREKRRNSRSCREGLSRGTSDMWHRRLPLVALESLCIPVEFGFESVSNVSNKTLSLWWWAKCQKRNLCQLVSGIESLKGRFAVGFVFRQHSPSESNLMDVIYMSGLASMEKQNEDKAKQQKTSARAHEQARSVLLYFWRHWSASFKRKFQKRSMPSL